MKKLLSLLIVLLHLANAINAQVAINTTGNAPASSAMLDVSSTNKGLLITRMTSAQRKAIASPELGLLVFDTDRQTIYLFDGADWKAMMVATEEVLPLTSRKGIGAAKGSGFGTAVDMYGDYAIVGAPNDSALGTNPGAAYIFTKQTGIWKQQARLLPPTGTSFDEFGASVSIYGDIAVVGMPKKPIGSLAEAGGAYVFKRTGHTWSQVAFLQASNGAANDHFGTCVDIHEDFIAIGAPERSHSGKTEAGSVYIFGLLNGAWVQKAIINASDPANSSDFGRSVGIWGANLVVGAPWATHNGIAGIGAAYTYNRNDGSGYSWSFHQKLTDAGTTTGTHYGHAVCIEDTTILVGIPKSDNGGLYPERGVVRPYRKVAGLWDNGTFKGHGEHNYAEAGTSVALGDGIIYSGAPGGGEGKVKIDAPGRLAKVKQDEDPQSIRKFGMSVSGYGKHYIIGAPVWTGQLGEEGLVYFGEVN